MLQKTVINMLWKGYALIKIHYLPSLAVLVGIEVIVDPGNCMDNCGVIPVEHPADVRKAHAVLFL